MIASKFQEVQHRTLLNIAQARRGTHRIALHETMENHRDLFPGEPHIGVEWTCWRFAVTLPALVTFESLNSLLAVIPGLDHFGPAIVAGHSTLAFFGPSSHN
ncbi:MAG: hypothetical protein H0X25_03295 [Acidobacteriales bacterium]|nr:hypothetical protein [Terriglobales bacterium]